MPQHAVLTAVGPDKPGLVDAVSKFILDAGCNIEDSRMAALGGEFAMLILVAGEEAGIAKVASGAGAAGEKSGLTVLVRRAGTPGGSKVGSIPYQIEAYSMDHPGIVQRVARFLAERRINVRALDTRVSHASVTGSKLFSLHATVDVPPDVNVIDLRKGLEQIGHQENIDLEVKPAAG